MKSREILKRIPVVVLIVKFLRSAYIKLMPKKSIYEMHFANMFYSNAWQGKESASGTGSDLGQTKAVIEALPIALDKYQIGAMLDIPCGDFNWMKHVRLGDVRYIGADIVRDLIDLNTRLFRQKNVQFRRLDITKDKLPSVDLILCRDCLVHLSFNDIFRALDRICQSKSGFLLTTTFSAVPMNEDIATGMWRPINLEIPPFRFPKPLELINEGCEENDGVYADKSLGLWKISDIEESLARIS